MGPTDRMNLTEMIAGKRILVIGDKIHDVDLHGRYTRFAAESPSCPVFTQDLRFSRPGGAAAVADMVHGLGALVSLITPRDASTKRRYFVDGRQVYRADDDLTAIEPAEEASLVARIAEDLPRADAVLIADYGKGACTWDVVRSAINGSACRSNLSAIPCIIDPHRTANWAYVKGATAIKCNAAEYRESVSNIAWSKLVENLIVTDGANGLRHHIPLKESQHYPARYVTEVDVTGAGDMVLAALGVFLAAGCGWRMACELAVIAAALKVERHGAVAVPLADLIKEGPFWGFTLD
jgi:D-beta-D-heptose 7-phosphate kinase/D-beta-D-heptose 1-phosphate adenosyltransferase